MERLTSPNINVDPGTDRFLHAAIGGKEIDWKQSRDSTLNVMINGPTSNGFGKDIFRKMARDLYGRLKAYAGEGTQYEYYKTAANRKKNRAWYLRSPRLNNTSCFDRTGWNGEADWSVASEVDGIAAAWCF